MLTDADYNSLSLLFDYVGKKFKDWELIDTNWGLRINEPLNFPVGGLYAKDYDQAGTEYWFYDGVLSYSVYVWVLLGAVCSGITIKKGKCLTSSSGNFILEKKPEAFSQELSASSRLFTPILNLNPKDFDTEDDCIKEASRLFEGVATFSEVKQHECIFTLKDGAFPQELVKKCIISFDISQDNVDEIYLSITDEAEEKALKHWSGKVPPPRSQTFEQKKSGIFGFIKRLFK